MGPFLALLLYLHSAGVNVERVSVPGPNGVNLDAALVLPAEAPKAPPVLAMHGCGGPFPSRDGQWAVVMARRGHVVLLPDSFGSRSLGSQCGERHRLATAWGLRRQDAIAAARWLLARPGTPGGGVVMMGWSDGGSTVLATAAVAPDLPAGLFRRFVAFYPGCNRFAQGADWKPGAALLILIGESDNWTPAAPCHQLQARDPADVTLIGYPGAYHDFDAPNQPLKVRGGTTTATGTATTGTNEPARQDALTRVPDWAEAR